MKYVYVCLSKQYITSTSKNISIKQHTKQQQKYLYGRNINHKLFLLRIIGFIIYYCLNRFLYIYKIFQLTEQNMYV